MVVKDKFPLGWILGQRCWLLSLVIIVQVLAQAAVNVLGSVYVASIATGAKINIFFATPFDALGTTMATYGGQNVGAGRPERQGDSQIRQARRGRESFPV